MLSNIRAVKIGTMPQWAENGVHHCAEIEASLSEETTAPKTTDLKHNRRRLAATIVGLKK